MLCSAFSCQDHLLLSVLYAGLFFVTSLNIFNRYFLVAHMPDADGISQLAVTRYFSLICAFILNSCYHCIFRIICLLLPTVKIMQVT